MHICRVWGAYNRVFSCLVLAIPGVKLHKNYLEMLKIVLALRLWVQFWPNSSVCIRRDILAVVQVVQSNRTKDSIPSACLRNISFVCALLNINLTESILGVV